MITGRRRISLSLVTTIALVGGLAVSRPATASGGPAPVDVRVLRAAGRTSALVHTAPTATLGAALRAARAAGLENGTRYDRIAVFVAYGTTDEFAALAKDPSIEQVEANAKIELFTSSSHQATRGQALLDGDVTTPAGATIDGSGVGVAVVDSGVDGTHPDLADRMGGNVEIVCTSPQFFVVNTLGGFTECRTPKAVVPMEDTDHPSAGGHGTHVAGIVAGTGEASNGLYHGAAPGATLYGVSVGSGDRVENGLDGLAWVLENHDQVSPPIRVLNGSWGGSYAKYAPEGTSSYLATWKMQEALIAEGVTLVWAAGNNGGDGTTPTTSGHCVNPTPGVICVANYDDGGTGTRGGVIDSSSSRGKTDLPETWPDVSAPGSGIVSTCRLTLPVCNAHAGMVLDPPNLYSSLSGTSMAAPHVAGIVAQMYQVDPTLTPAEVEDVVEDTAYKLQWGSPYGLLPDATNTDDTSSFDKGHGLVDALAAVQSLMGVPPSPDPTPAPTPTPTPTPAGTRYYFHSATGYGEADSLTGGVTFDTTAPGPGTYAETHDVRGVTGGDPIPTDPRWHGAIEGPFTSFTLDFWAKAPVGEIAGSLQFHPRIFVGGTTYRLPALEAELEPNVGTTLAHVTHTYTTMLDAADSEVPLSIDPDGPVTISIEGGRRMYEDGWYIAYDSVDYPSGFFAD